MIILYLITYLSILFFLSVVIIRLIKYIKTPVHLRWDLYPVAHEKGKNKYGGSYYEEVKWYEKKAPKSHLADLWVMFEEIFFLKGVYKNNKRLWYFSFPFHLGLYFTVGTFTLNVITVLLDMTGALDIFWQTNLAENILNNAIIIMGYLGLVLTFGGSIGLIIERVTDKKFKFYNMPMDFINLTFILILSISMLLTISFSNSNFILYKIYIRNLLTFNFTAIAKPMFSVHIVLVALFLFYFPLTRMMHFFAKYFTYHEVRWEDNPNFKGGKLEAKIKQALNYGVSWDAPHVKTGKTWGEVATKVPPEVTNAK